MVVQVTKQFVLYCKRWFPTIEKTILSRTKQIVLFQCRLVKLWVQTSQSGTLPGVNSHFMTGKPRNSLENFRVCYGDTRGFLTMFQDFATRVQNVSLRQREFCQNTPPSNQNLLKPLCLLGFEQGGVFVNTPPTLHQHPTFWALGGVMVGCWCSVCKHPTQLKPL